MRALRLAPACLLLAGLALLPLAHATPPAACAPDDVVFWYNLAHSDETVEQVAWLDETREGDAVWMQGGAHLHCAGQPVSVLVSVCAEDGPTLVAAEETTMLPPWPDAEFVYFELEFDIPLGPYAVGFWLGAIEDEDAVLLDAAADPACAPPPPDCPADLAAHANDDGSVTLTWTASAGAEDYYVMRMEDDESGWRRVAVTEETTWTDEDTEPGKAYRYWVMAHAEGQWSMDCAIVDATAVPFFGAPVLAALAVAGSVGAYAWLRRT